MRAPPVISKLSFLLAGYCLTLAAPAAHCQVSGRTEFQKITASDASEHDRFGASVSASGDHVIVGAWGADNAGSATGAAYVYRRDDNRTALVAGDDVWIQEDKLTASDAAAGDLFGWSVSMSGDRAIVGARFHIVTGRSGAAYVFRRDDKDTPTETLRWVQEGALLTPNDAAAGDQFGISVAIDHDRAIVGASGDDDACGDDPKPDCDSGSAYVFRRADNGTASDRTDDYWVLEAKLTASDAAAGDEFGFAVSISGDRAIVGAWHEDHLGTDSGAAYVFRRDDGGTPADPTDDTWIEEYKLTPSDGAAFDNFGVSVSNTSDRVIVGAWLDDDAGSLSGSAYVFRREDNATISDPTDDRWVEEDKLTASDAAAGDEFGKSVSIHGDYVAIGAFEDDDACAGDPNPDPDCDSGAAYLFRRTNIRTPLDAGDDSWIQIAKLTGSDAAAGSFFGRVGLSEGWLIAGSLDPAEGNNSGAAYVFPVAWPPTNLADFADFQVCLTGDGGGVQFGCGIFDFDDDGDIDLKDYACLLPTFVGP